MVSCDNDSLRSTVDDQRNNTATRNRPSDKNEEFPTTSNQSSPTATNPTNAVTCGVYPCGLFVKRGGIRLQLRPKDSSSGSFRNKRKRFVVDGENVGGEGRAVVSTSTSSQESRPRRTFVATATIPTMTTTTAEEIDGGDDVGANELPCDALLALRSIVQRGAAAFCPSTTTNNSNPTGYPFVLERMLHMVLSSTCRSSSFSCEDRVTAAADVAANLTRELSELRRDNRIRVLYLHPSSSSSVEAGRQQHEEDVVVMETSVYVRAVRDAPCDDPVASRSFERLLPSETRPSVSRTDLTTRHGLTSSRIEALVRARLLVVAVGDDADVYRFSLPTLGVAARRIADGRARIVRRIERSMGREVRRDELLCGAAPRGDHLPMAFYVRDLESRGIVDAVERPSGVFLMLRARRKRGRGGGGGTR